MGNVWGMGEATIINPPKNGIAIFAPKMDTCPKCGAHEFIIAYDFEKDFFTMECNMCGDVTKHPNKGKEKTDG